LPQTSLHASSHVPLQISIHTSDPCSFISFPIVPLPF
jgi:hypothetical protein